MSDDLIRVILNHHLRATPSDGCFCGCGAWSVGRGPHAGEAHARHLAEAIREEWKP